MGKVWDTSFFSFTAAHEVMAGAGIAKINVGETQQVIEIADFQIYTFPVGFDISGKAKTFEIKHATNGGKPTLKLEE